MDLNFGPGAFQGQSRYLETAVRIPAGTGAYVTLMDGLITDCGAEVGRRKEAVARVRVVPGSGKWTINGRTLDSYFPNKLHQQIANEPFVELQLEGRFDVIARIHGGGIAGQAGALRLGVARALNAVDVEANRATLKKAGLLTRDARVVERKKAGLKKARKAPQFSKR